MKPAKTVTPAPTRRLRWIGGTDRYLPGIPARDLDENDLDRLDYVHELAKRSPVAADLVASGLYEYATGNPPETTENPPETPAELTEETL